MGWCVGAGSQRGGKREAVIAGVASRGCGSAASRSMLLAALHWQKESGCWWFKDNIQPVRGCRSSALTERWPSSRCAIHEPRVRQPQARANYAPRPGAPTEGNAYRRDGRWRCAATNMQRNTAGPLTGRPSPSSSAASPNTKGGPVAPPPAVAGGTREGGGCCSNHGRGRRCLCDGVAQRRGRRRPFGGGI